MIKKVVFLGAGNLATQLAKALHQKGVQIVQVYSRRYTSAQALASQFGSKSTADLKSVSDEGDLYIFALKDDALPAVLSAFPHKNKAVVHTAGSMPMDVFKQDFKTFGVFYPLQTFSKSKELSFAQIPICIEANSESLFKNLWQLGEQLSSDVRKVNSEQRKALHLAAVFVCNFVNHFYVVGHELMEKHSMSFDMLKPLIKETADKVMNAEPKDVQTGPAVRYDQGVMQKHINQLQHDESLQDLYKTMSNLIFKTQNKDNNMEFVKNKLMKIKALVFDVDGVLSSDTSTLGEDGVPMRTTNTKDGFSIRNAVNMGYKVAIITGGDAKRVELRYKKVGVEHIYMGVDDKVKVLQKFIEEVGVSLDEVLYMGDDLIDYKVMDMVGYPCCPRDAVSEVKEIAACITEKIGGAGCVREVIEQVMRAQGTWLNENVYTWRST